MGRRMSTYGASIDVAGVHLDLLRPVSPEALIDEDLFEEEEFLPYWAELWPAATALAEALPGMAGMRVVELGCGLGVPSLVAARKGADVTATDWAGDAIGLLRENAARNGIALRAEVRDWREPWDERFDLALAADVLYEAGNVDPLVDLLPRIAPRALVGLAGRPYERTFLDRIGEAARVREQGRVAWIERGQRGSAGE